MLRYIGLVWDDSKISERNVVAMLMRRLRISRGAWSVATRQKGLGVYYAGARQGACEPHVLQNSGGVLLGTIFSRDSGIYCSKLNESESARVMKTEGRHLIGSYWGRYVAFIRDPVSHDVFVLRDPTGRLRCFLTFFQGVKILFSNAEDCVDLGLEFSINWDYMAAELVGCCGPAGWLQTGLKEISMIRAGDCLKITKNSTCTISYWRPEDFSADILDDPAKAITDLRREIRQCVHSWATCYPKIFFMLSGGLDSSIVASCLRDAPSFPAMDCYHLYNHGIHDDERRYAKLAAKMAGFKLIEQERRPDVRLEPILNLPKTARPSSNLTAHVLYALSLTALAKQKGATAIFQGQRGDQLFCSHRGALAAIDYARIHGMKPSLLTAALDTACWTGKSFWGVLARAVVFGSFRKSKFNDEIAAEFEKDRRPLINPQLAEKVDGKLLRPWLDVTNRSPIGKLLHTNDICAAQAYVENLGEPSDPETVWPLYSQPIIELCLRIPVYLHAQGGWDRSIARQAFAHDVPEAIIVRRAKGGNAAQVNEVFSRNSEFIRELLLDGILARENMLDRRELEKLLSAGAFKYSEPIDHLLWTEAWLRVWLEGRREIPVQRIYDSVQLQ